MTTTNEERYIPISFRALMRATLMARAGCTANESGMPAEGDTLGALLVDIAEEYDRALDDAMSALARVETDVSQNKERLPFGRAYTSNISPQRIAESFACSAVEEKLRAIFLRAYSHAYNVPGHAVWIALMHHAPESSSYALGRLRDQTYDRDFIAGCAEVLKLAFALSFEHDAWCRAEASLKKLMAEQAALARVEKQNAEKKAKAEERAARRRERAAATKGGA